MKYIYMKKDEFNVYEFHIMLEKIIAPMKYDETHIQRKMHIEQLLLDKSISYTDELEYNKEITEINHKIDLFTSYQEYKTLTDNIIQEYKTVLNCTIKDSFVKKKNNVTPDVMLRKKKCVEDYLNIIRSFPNLTSFLPQFKSEHKSFVCPDCNVDYENYETRMICPNCYCEQPFMYQDETISFKDFSRINNNMKFSYIRQTHFRDTMKQFQGKQNKYIDGSVYKILHQCVSDSGLTQVNAQGKYTQITKDHIKMFLQENGLYKYYEDMNLIYSELTGLPCPDIGNYEKQLMDDFERILVVYDKVIKESSQYTRSNFLNSYYVLYQLLKKNQFPCKEGDFPIIKTIDRKIEHDEIYEKCCLLLGWVFYPTV